MREALEENLIWHEAAQEGIAGPKCRKLDLSAIIDKARTALALTEPTAAEEGKGTT
jgi:hypothetical protein